MDLVISFLIGVFVGGVVGFLVYRNNNKKFENLRFIRIQQRHTRFKYQRQNLWKLQRSWRQKI